MASIRSVKSEVVTPKGGMPTVPHDVDDADTPSTNGATPAPDDDAFHAFGNVAGTLATNLVSMFGDGGASPPPGAARVAANGGGAQPDPMLAIFGGGYTSGSPFGPPKSDGSPFGAKRSVFDGGGAGGSALPDPLMDLGGPAAAGASNPPPAGGAPNGIIINPSLTNLRSDIASSPPSGPVSTVPGNVQGKGLALPDGAAPVSSSPSPATDPGDSSPAAGATDPASTTGTIDPSTTKPVSNPGLQVTGGPNKLNEIAAAAAAQPAPAAPAGPDPQTVLNGDATTLPDPSATCPPGVSMQQMMDADGGLLKNLGNQVLQGAGAAGITGGIADNLAKKCGGTSAADIGTNPDVTWRALQSLQAFKNTPGSDGKPVPDDVRHNGNVSGLQPSNEVARGSTLGEMQDWFKGAIQGPNAQLPVGDKVDSSGVETSGATQVGQKILSVIDAIGAGIGKIFTGIKDVVVGAWNALKGVGEAIGGALTGNMDLMQKGGGDFVSGVKGAVNGVTTAAKGVVDTAFAPTDALTGGVGKTVNKFIDGSLDQFGQSADSAVDGVANAGEDLVTGNFQGLGTDVGNVVNFASDFIPGEGEVKVAAEAGESAVKTVLQNGAKDAAKGSAESQAQQDATT